MKIVVIGAGVIGAATSFLLARAGHDVTVLERNAAPARATSYANGGQLSYSYVEPMAGPAFLAKLAPASLGLDETLRVRWRLHPAFLAWGLAFLGHCTPPARQAALTAALSLSRDSRTALAAIEAAAPLAFDKRRAGKLILHASTADLDAARRLVGLKREYGIETAVLDRRACIATEPALERFGRPFAGGVFAPGDDVGDARAFAEALLREAAARWGLVLLADRQACALVRRGGRIDCVETNQGPVRGDFYVLCAGPWSARLAATAGLRLPIVPVKGYSLTLRAGPAAPTMSITDSARRMVFARLGDRLRIAGFADVMGDGNLDPHEAEKLRRLARESLPDAGDYDGPAESWAGLRPMTPSGLPLTGASRIANLYLNTGHGGLGWTWAAGSAQRLLDSLPA